jgi:hypothetical protein
MTRWIHVLVAALGASSIASAQAGELWSPNVKITGVYPHGTGFTVYTEYVNAAFSTCGGNRYSVSLSNPNYKALVATLLVAASSGKSIQMHFDSDAPTCEPVFDRFIMS